MRLRVLGGGRAAALAANARLRGPLAARLQIAPSALTRELADRIRAGDELLPPLAIAGGSCSLTAVTVAASSGSYAGACRCGPRPTRWCCSDGGARPPSTGRIAPWT